MLSAIRRNFGLKVFAFALAVAAWAYFHFSAGPNITAHFDQQLSVPIVVTNLHPGYVARYTDQIATVTIDSPRNGPSIRPEQVKAVLNLGNQAETGVYNIPVEIIAPKFQIRSLSPASVTLSLDRVDERSVPISIDYVGDHSKVVMESAAVNPASVTLRGIATDLARVVSVSVQIELPTKTTTLDESIRPIAIDDRGREVSTIQVSPNLVRVRVRFIPSSGTESK